MRFLPASLTLCLVLFVAVSATAQGPFVNFESPQSNHAISVLGDRLFVVNTPDNRLSVFDLTSNPPSLITEIPVGLEPVGVAPRPGHPNEVWVIGHISDDVTIVDVSLGRAVATIAVPDEPADIVFMADGARAYVSCSQANQVVSIDATTRAIDKTFDIPMEDPRGLALSGNGKFLVIAVCESGNKTTIVPAADAPASDPQVGLIVDDSDPLAPITVPDKDVWVVKTASNTLLSKTVRGVGTINFAVGVHPFNNKAYVVNTEALNLVQFEPNLRGHMIDSRVTIIRKRPGAIDVTPVDLNPSIDYGILPNPAAQAIALSQPTGIEFDPQNGNVFVAAFGSARVAVLDADGVVENRIDVGMGPRALAMDDPRRRLFVLNRLDNTVTSINVDTETVVTTFPIGRDGFDPTPQEILDGRPFLYDAGLSGNGTASCAACHIDAHSDHISWDIGDEDQNQDPRFPGAKGPMFTQSLRDLEETAPYHWRGDRPSFLNFAGAYDSLLGAGADLPVADMQKFEDFVFTVKYPPNPIQKKDRTLGTAADRAMTMFTDTSVFGGFVSCATCHEFPFGEANTVIPGQVLNESQGFNPGLLLGLWDKTGYEETGFAFLHDGSEPTVQEFLSTSPPFPFFTTGEKNDFNELMMEWDSGIAPSVGRRVLVDATNASDPQVTQLILEIIGLSWNAHLDVAVHGAIDGINRGFWYDPRIDEFVSSRSTDPSLSLAQMQNLALAGRAELTFTAVPLGSGRRIAVDRDNDELFDDDEIALGTDPLIADSDGDTHLDGVEVAAGSDPLSAASVPGSTSSPNLTGASGMTALPFPDFDRLQVTGTDIRPGATIELTTGGGAITNFSLFPIGPNTWATHHTRDQGGTIWSGQTAVVTNRDGGVSPPFVIP